MEDPYPVENINRLGVLILQTIVSSLKYKNTQPISIFNRENPQNSESPNGPRRGLDFIALAFYRPTNPVLLLK